MSCLLLIILFFVWVPYHSVQDRLVPYFAQGWLVPYSAQGRLAHGELVPYSAQGGLVFW